MLNYLKVEKGDTLFAVETPDSPFAYFNKSSFQKELQILIGSAVDDQNLLILTRGKP